MLSVFNYFNYYYLLNLNGIIPSYISNFTIYNLIVYLFFITFFLSFYQNIFKKRDLLLHRCTSISMTPFIANLTNHITSFYLLVSTKIVDHLINIYIKFSKRGEENNTPHLTTRHTRRQITGASSNSSRSGSIGSSGSGSPKPPKKNWREKLKENLIDCYQSHGLTRLIPIALLAGLVEGSIFDLTIITFNDLITTNDSEIHQISELLSPSDELVRDNYRSGREYWEYVSQNRDIYSFIDSQFSDILRVKKIIDQLQLGLSVGLNLLGFRYYYLDSIYILLGLVKYHSELFESEESVNLFLIHFLNHDFINRLPGFIRLLPLEEYQMYRSLLKGTNVLTHYLSYNEFKFLVLNYHILMEGPDIDRGELSFYFNLSTLSTSLNAKQELAVLVFNKDIMTGLQIWSKTRTLDNTVIANLMLKQFLNVLYGFHDLDSLPYCIVTTQEQLHQFKSTCFIQALRKYVEYKRLINPEFNIIENQEDYEEFSDFFRLLAQNFSGQVEGRFNSRSYESFNYNFTKYYNLIISFDYEDIYGMNRDKKVPTTLTPKLKEKIALVSTMFSESSLIDPIKTIDDK